MKRTKEWWAQLAKEERSELVTLERADAYGGRSAYLPDDCSECGYCSTPHLGSGLCPQCLKRLIALIDKADAGVIASTNPQNSGS